MFKESLQIQRDAGDATYQALCLNAIGNVYLARGESEDALTYFQQALQLREKLNVPGDIADTLGNLGVTNVNSASTTKPPTPTCARSICIARAGTITARHCNRRASE